MSQSKIQRDTIFVPGIPLPKGSYTAMLNPKFRAWLISMGVRLNLFRGPQTISFWQCGRELKAWHNQIRATVQGRAQMIGGACSVDLTFFMPRPKSHYKKSGALTARAPVYPETKPDGDKLTRTVLDALEGIYYQNDSRIVDYRIRLRYAKDTPGVALYVESMEPPELF